MADKDIPSANKLNYSLKIHNTGIGLIKLFIITIFILISLAINFLI